MSLQACVPLEWKQKLNSESENSLNNNCLLKKIGNSQHKNTSLYKYHFKDDEEPDISAKKLKWSNEVETKSNHKPDNYIQ